MLKWVVVVEARYADGDTQECHPSIHGPFSDEDSALAFQRGILPKIKEMTEKYNASSPPVWTLTAAVYVTTLIEGMDVDQAASLYGAYLGL